MEANLSAVPQKQNPESLIGENRPVLPPEKVTLSQNRKGSPLIFARREGVSFDTLTSHEVEELVRAAEKEMRAQAAQLLEPEPSLVSLLKARKSLNRKIRALRFKSI